jgi:hypothetical protein
MSVVKEIDEVEVMLQVWGFFPIVAFARVSLGDGIQRVLSWFDRSGSRFEV